MNEEEQYLEDKYGAIYPEEIGQDDKGIFLTIYSESDDEDGRITIDKKKAYFEDKDIPLLEKYNLK